MTPDRVPSFVADTASYMGLPLPTYEVPDEQLVQIGGTARLFCEAFVGESSLRSMMHTGCGLLGTWHLCSGLTSRQCEKCLPQISLFDHNRNVFFSRFTSGSIDLPDAQSEIMWSRVGMNTTYFEEHTRFTLRSVARYVFTYSFVSLSLV